MTECMPISTPPLGYALDRPGTSGVMCGPEIKIFDLEGNSLEPHKTGLVVLKGMPCFKGYLNNEEANKESFFEGGWFNTGDCGYLDEDGFLFITGRMKEIINRGGETISPFEIEDAVKSHPDIEQCMAFSAPHDRLQECVGIALVAKTPGDRTLTLPKLQRFLSSKLHPSKWPMVIVYIDRLPQVSSMKSILAILNWQHCLDRHRCAASNSFHYHFLTSPLCILHQLLGDTFLPLDQSRAPLVKFFASSSRAAATCPSSATTHLSRRSAASSTTRRWVRSGVPR